MGSGGCWSVGCQGVRDWKKFVGEGFKERGVGCRVISIERARGMMGRFKASFSPFLIFSQDSKYNHAPAWAYSVRRYASSLYRQPPPPFSRNLKRRRADE